MAPLPRHRLPRPTRSTRDRRWQRVTVARPRASRGPEGAEQSQHSTGSGCCYLRLVSPLPRRHRGDSALVPEKKVLYQFSARGHDVAQLILGELLDHPHDGAGAYYRSRPLLLTLGLSARRRVRRRRWASRAASATGATSGWSATCPSEPGAGGAADVGRRRLPVHARPPAGPRRSPTTATCSSDAEYAGAIACVLGRRGLGRDQRILVGAHDRDDAQAADGLLHRGQRLRHLRARRSFQTPGGNIAANLASLPEPPDPRGRRHRSRRGTPACSRESDRPCPRRQGPGAAAAHRAAALAVTRARIPRPTRPRSCSSGSRRAIRCPGSTPVFAHGVALRRPRSRRSSRGRSRTSRRRSLRRWPGPSPIRRGHAASLC